ncbi:MAG: YjbQ family protein [Parcubacteria group bacterium]|nr:YjbQ family protein [Parcubacteria group bacterium]
MEKIIIQTKKFKEIVDLTDLINKKIQEDKFEEGLCHLFLLHTTAALTCADLDPGTDLDMFDAFEAIMPKLKYRHSHNPAHTPDHILSAMIGVSLFVPVRDGNLELGEWQRAVLIELDGPREREVAISYVKTF